MPLALASVKLISHLVCEFLASLLVTVVFTQITLQPRNHVGITFTGIRVITFFK